VSTDAHIGVVRDLMAQFAHRTRMDGDVAHSQRYLWTDAFAVGNYLGLYRAGERVALDSAKRLVAHVHRTLGRHRRDDPRTGWISGLAENEGSAHPTRGGLRIGKRLPERGPEASFDEQLEWERDGQYFHYLTKWMHALAGVAHVADEGVCLRQAIELARAAHAGFTYTPRAGSGPRMVWKMSIDLTRPLVPSMGQHDPLDGLLTFHELRRGALRFGWSAEAESLEGPIHDMRTMCAGMGWATADALGIGGLLCDVYRLVQLSAEDDSVDGGLLRCLLHDCTVGLSAFARTGRLHAAAAERLAFRELGLAIGLRATARLVERGVSGRDLDALRRFVPLADDVEQFWLDSGHRATEAWRAHRDINEVMLATSLMPDGFLDL
jgi:hypothetical protein